MKDHLSTSTESHLNALCELVYAQKKQLENQRERIQLQKEHIQLQKETFLLQKQEIIDVRSRTANGEFIWRITDFTRKLMDVKSGRAPEPMISEPFYTHPHGYKLSAGLWLNGVGTGRGRYISVGLQVSTAETSVIRTRADELLIRTIIEYVGTFFNTFECHRQIKCQRLGILNVAFYLEKSLL